MNIFDVFISYNSGIKDQVKKLDKVLKSLNYKVWLDERELNAGSSPLTAELAMAIKNSKVILSCITTDYCKSFNFPAHKFSFFLQKFSFSPKKAFFIIFSAK